MLYRIAGKIFSGLLLFALSACASIVDGSQQSLSVQTVPIAGAQCTLINDKGTWFVPLTPGSVTVHRSYDDLNTICKRGDLRGVQTVKSSTKGMTFGNILFGGLIGAGVDAGTGAAYDYPPLITVQMSDSSRGAAPPAPAPAGARPGM